MIIYNNKIIEIYRSNDGFADEKRLAKYCDKNGILKKGYRDVPTKYICRKDLKEVIYDRQALFKVSKNLGHNRENVVVGHYLYH